MNTAAYTFDLFSKKEGSKHIIQQYALNRVIKYINYKKPKRVLEVGIGIGTIPFALQEAKARGEIKHDFEYYGTEAYPFCVDAFRKNVPGHESFIRHYPALADVPRDRKYDFIIVDGKDDSTADVPQLLEKGGVVIIEGGRSMQRNKVQDTRRNYIKFGEVGFSLGRLGGLTVFFFEPSFTDKLIYCKSKITSAVKYRAAFLLRSEIKRG